MPNWVPTLLAAIVPLVAGWQFNIYLTRKRERQQQENGTSGAPPVLNGYAAILRDTLAQLRLKDEEIALLRERLADCQGHGQAPSRPARRRRATSD